MAEVCRELAPNRERELLPSLVRLCRGDEPGLPSSDGAWDDLFQLAWCERCVPLAWRSSRPAIAAAGATAESRWSGAMLRVRWNVRRQLAVLARVAAALESAAVPTVQFKGPVLAQQLYGDPAARVTGDLDVGIAPADRARADEVLRSIGLAHDSGVAPGEASYECVEEGAPIKLEVHSVLLDDRKLLPRTLPIVPGPWVMVEGLRLRGLEPSVLAVFLAMELAAKPGLPLFRLFDFEGHWRTMSEAERTAAHAIARQHGFERYVAWALAQSALLAPVAAGSTEAIARLVGVRRQSQLRSHLTLAGSVRDATRYVVQWVWPGWLHGRPTGRWRWVVARMRGVVRRMAPPAVARRW